MADSVLSDLSTALDLIVLEQLPAGGFVKCAGSHTPSWFLDAFQHGRADQPVSLLEAFPVLDAFLKDAESVWSGYANGRADSEPFIVQQSGRDVPVTATALAVQNRRYLTLQRAVGFENTQRLLQTAREHSLAHERLVAQLQALRTPIATLARLVDDPSFTSDQRSAAADAIRQQVDVLRGLLDDLPQGPRGATARRR